MLKIKPSQVIEFIFIWNTIDRTWYIHPRSINTNLRSYSQDKFCGLIIPHIDIINLITSESISSCKLYSTLSIDRYIKMHYKLYLHISTLPSVTLKT